jgi:hypothetical protein
MMIQLGCVQALRRAVGSRFKDRCPEKAAVACFRNTASVKSKGPASRRGSTRRDATRRRVFLASPCCWEPFDRCEMPPSRQTRKAETRALTDPREGTCAVRGAGSEPGTSPSARCELKVRVRARGSGEGRANRCCSCSTSTRCEMSKRVEGGQLGPSSRRIGGARGR